MIFLGIDIGVNGGLAMIDQNGTVGGVWKMPETDYDLLEALRVVARVPGGSAELHAMIERVSSSPVQGVKQAFTFGGEYRRVKMALTAAHIRYDEVAPKKWQRRLDCLTGGDKKITKARAQQLFPGFQGITHATADALLLAEYCRREQLGLGSLVTPGTDKDDLGALS